MDASQQESWDLDTDEIRSIDSDELHETRPNRWHGPPGTWREFTEEERLLHHSLEQTRNQDLAVHLYNAFALKRPREAPQEPPITESSIQPPVASQLALEDSAGDWRPPARWTSWPLHVSRVPNEELVRETHDEHDEFTTRKKEREMPSQKLEEEVTAAILRAAKERFRSRDLRPGEDEDEPSTEEDSQPDDAPDREESPAMVKRDPSHVSEDGEETEAADESAAAGSQDPEAAAAEDTVYRPEVSVDDGLSHDILRPSVRHILAQMDATLHTLHHARVAGLFTFDKRDDSDSDESSVTSVPRRKSTKQKGKAKSRAKDSEDEDSAANTSDGEDADDESVADDDAAKDDDKTAGKSRGQGDSSPEAPKSRHRRDRSRRYDKGERVGRWGLRDWRDVLGSAAISGFDKDVVARAAQRCADLFGQSMELHTMEEGGGKYTTTVCKPGGGQVRGLGEADMSSGEEQHLEEERRRKRLKADIERRQRDVRAWRSHTRSAAVSDDEGFRTAEEEPGSNDNDDSDDQPLVAIDINKVEASPDGLFHCPIPYCKRHEKGFPAKRGLREHYRLTHDQPTAERGTFYCPFVQCKYHTQSFKTKKNLRVHIKNMHRGQSVNDADVMDIDTEERRGAAPVLTVLDSEDEMDGDVHVDGFLRPIKIRKGWLTKGGREKGRRNKSSRAAS